MLDVMPPDPLGPLLDEVAALWGSVRGAAKVRRATVTQASPLRVRMTGEDSPMSVAPMSLVTGLRVGQRVLCVEQHGRVLVVAGADQGWTDITSLVTLAPGLQWASGGRMHACVVGGVVGLRMEHALTRSAGFVDVPVSGNVVNTTVVSGIPAPFRPTFAAPLTSGPLGRAGTYAAYPDGTVQLTGITPNTTWTSTTPLPADEGISFGGTYPR